MRIVICDDNPDELKRYEYLLKELAEKHAVTLDITQYDRGEPLLFASQSPTFAADIIFLDINMPGILGVDVAKKLREYGYKNEIIFITVSKNHMLNAFDVGALHYVVKGETDSKQFEEIFLRAVKAAEEKDRQYVLFSGGGESRNIPVNSVKYFEVYNKEITVYYDKETSFEFISTLDKLEKQLFEYGFFRIKKNYLVNLTQIETVTAKDVTLRDGTNLTIGRKYYKPLKAALANG